jgi:hypothetical protein
LSLEEVELTKQMYVGTASPTRISSQDDSCNQFVHGIQECDDEGKYHGEFEEYLTERLKHLSKEDQAKLKQILKEYHLLFFKEGSLATGCTSQVKHTIETGDGQPIKINPYRIPHCMKPVVEEHIDDMLKKGIIEPSMSPWSSSIFLVPKKDILCRL